jgi:hypothetical protein
VGGRDDLDARAVLGQEERRARPPIPASSSTTDPPDRPDCRDCLQPSSAHGLTAAQLLGPSTTLTMVQKLLVSGFSAVTCPDRRKGHAMETPLESPSFDRRAFLQGTVGALALGTLTGAPRPAEAAAVGPENDKRRAHHAFEVRRDAAHLARHRPRVDHPSNGEEDAYPNKIASFSKALPHNERGEVDLGAYGALLRALRSGRKHDFESIPLGLGRKLTNPMAGIAFDLEGPDSHHLTMRPAPTIAGAEAAAEMAELYWMALTRDVAFSDYETDPLIAEAATDLSRFRDFRGPKRGSRVVPETIFRGHTPGDLIGPYLSQFLWLPIPMGALHVPQRMLTVMPGVDYLTDYTDWLAVQNGLVPGPYALDPTPRYIRNQRDLGEWVHVDALYQAYHQACLILLGLNAPLDSGNPYTHSETQIGFGTFGGPHILSLVTEVATRALKAVWYQKWFVHRRLRPEAFGGLVHNALTRHLDAPLHPDLLGSEAIDRTAARHGTFLLPVAAPEGCPTHPSYGAGHATVAGACVTILKAWFDESFVVPNPGVPDPSGTTLLPYAGPPLTVGHELDKLAANVAIGRNALGFHYRSEYSDSLVLGEAVAIGILEEQGATFAESGHLSLRKFDGTTITI